MRSDSRGVPSYIIPSTFLSCVTNPCLRHSSSHSHLSSQADLRAEICVGVDGSNLEATGAPEAQQYIPEEEQPDKQVC